MPVEEQPEEFRNADATRGARRRNSRVSVIIPTYNRSHVLKDCLRAALSQTYADLQIVVTDDSQNDLVKTVLAEIDDGNRIEYRRNPIRLGLPANRNAGLTIATGDLVLFLDDDSIMERDCIENLVFAYDSLSLKGADIGAIGPSLITEQVESRGQFLEFGVRSLSMHQSSPVVRNSFTGISRMNFRPEHSGVMQVDELHSNSIYAREVLKCVGGYEERLYQGNYLCEETDLHARIKRRGYRLYFNPSAVIHHMPAESGGCRTSSVRYGYYYFRNHAMYIVRNHGLRSIYMVPSFLLYLSVFGLLMVTRYALTTTNGERRE